MVTEHRLATFVKDRVRRAVPSVSTPGGVRSAPSSCSLAATPGTWYSQQAADGTWCTGQPPTTLNQGARHEQDNIPSQDPAPTIIIGWENPVRRESGK